ncbi:unnamed protein product, partial [Dovyalis caffra]
MAIISHFNQYSCNNLFKITPLYVQFSSARPSITPLSSTKIIPASNNSILKSRILVNREPIKTRPLFLVKAVDGEEKKLIELVEIDSLKTQLLNSLHGTDHRLIATSETRAKVVELMAQLEARNPNLPLRLCLCSMASGFLKIKEISQTIDSENFTVQNSAQFSGPIHPLVPMPNLKSEAPNVC